MLAAALLAVASLALTSPQTPPAAGALRVGAYASRHAGDTFLTITAVVVLPATVKPSAATVTLVDARGTTLHQWKAAATDLRRSALTTTFLAPAGRYTVRATISDAARRPITGEGDVVAALTPVPGGLSVSEITVGTTEVPFCPRPSLMQGGAGTARFELYGGKVGMPVSIVAELTNDTGAVLQKLTPKVTGTPEPDRFIVNLPLDLSALTAGHYTIRAVIGIDGQPTATLTGTLRLLAHFPLASEKDEATSEK